MVLCSVFRAAREYEGGAKTVKAAGDGGIQLNTGPLERRLGYKNTYSASRERRVSALVIA